MCGICGEFYLQSNHAADTARLRGMFGIALYDMKRLKLVLARDRLGIKPIYYWQDAEKLVYGSEIKTLPRHPGVSTAPDEMAIFQFLLLRHSLTPDTMFQGVRIQSYWAMRHDGPSVRHMDEAARRYAGALANPVDYHLLTDVPLGMFLSGGLDSSVLAALVQQRSSRPVVCFTASFQGGTDEGTHAAVVARHIGAEHRTN